MQEQTIILVSSALGDTLAWVPVVEEYQKQKQCKIKLITCYNELFNQQYPNIEFIQQSQIFEEWFSTHSVSPSWKDLGVQLIGMWYSPDDYDHDRHPTNPFARPLQQVAADVLGIDFNETRPRVNFTPSEPTIDGKYICIAPQSTAQMKFWNYESGWQQVIDYYVTKGYKVVYTSFEDPTSDVSIERMGSLKRIIDHSGQSLTKTMNDIHHSNAVIGLSSGVSWLAWALKANVVLISGFTPEEMEFNCERVINKNVCNGCWGRTFFDKGDWMACPDHNGSSRMFECTKQISPNMVIEATNRVVDDSVDVV